MDKDKVKYIMFVILLVFVLNRMGLLDEKLSSKVDGFETYVKDQIEEITYKDKPLNELTTDDIVAGVKSDVDGVKKQVIIPGGVRFKADGIDIKVTPLRKTIVYIDLDTKNNIAVESAEKLISQFMNKEFKFEKKELDDNKYIKVKLYKDNKGIHLKTF